MNILIHIFLGAPMTSFPGKIIRCGIIGSKEVQDFFLKQYI